MTAAVALETTLAVRDACLCLHTQRAARALARRFDEALRPAGLTNGQFSLLNALNGAEPAPIRRVAAALGADRTTLTAALKPLVREGLAEISVDPADHRSRRVTLTAAGRDRLGAALPLWAAAHAALEIQLADPDRARRDLLTLSAPRAPAAPLRDA
ncbi:MAG: winged helix-turn-helix transcriptional regulator [Phenylobacterium sp.]|nr:winged helix-turn-helix transcriptional regulator [Phenylobacterium sp.]